MARYIEVDVLQRAGIASVYKVRLKVSSPSEKKLIATRSLLYPVVITTHVLYTLSQSNQSGAKCCKNIHVTSAAGCLVRVLFLETAEY